MFDKNYLGHNLINYDLENNNYFLCMKCNVKGFHVKICYCKGYFDNNCNRYFCNRYFYLRNASSLDLLSCDEMMIKNIIE